MKFKSKIAQVESEIAAFIDILKAENVRSYLEIGSQYGGSLWRAANALPKGSRVVSVDLPHGDGSTAQHLKECVSALNMLGYDTTLILGDSTKEETIGKVRASAPFDAIFIDANHTLPFVIDDWENYGPMGRIIAFHDIAFDKQVREGRLPIEVWKLWRSIKDQYKTTEIIAPGSDKGIGVLWRS